MKAINGIIYRVVNRCNGKSYIGKTTVGLSKRKRIHLSDAKAHKYGSVFHSALLKYGEDVFCWYIIERHGCIHDLDLAEEWYIRKYRTFVGFNGCNGYNLTLGGDGVVGFKHTKESKLKLHKAHTGRVKTNEHISKIASANRGRHVSKEARLKMSLARKGKKFTKQHRRKISKAKTGVKRAPFTEEALRNMSLSKKGRRNFKNEKIYIITTPKGDEFVVKGLNNFCKNQAHVKLYSKYLSSCAKGNISSYKGFKCRYFDENADVILPVSGGAI